VLPVQGDAHALPLAEGAADVVVAGEVLEHVTDLERVVAEIARVLRPGGIVVVDTINDTWWSRLALVTVGEHVPGGPPRGIHDPKLFVRPERLKRLFARHGVQLAVRGLRPSAVDLVRFVFRRRRTVRMVPTRSVGLVYQGLGKKVERG
jgi:2-polyprenyl-6-hydroxyphenyl methylase/3-demethylubiquinone-9 3-methyltransferase